MYAAVMERVSNDDEIKRVIEGAVAKFEATVAKIGQHMESMGPDFTKMPNPLPGVATELIHTMSALKKYRDDYARGLKSLDQLRVEAAQLRQKYKDKQSSIQKREEDLVAREHKLAIAVACHETRSSSHEDRSRELGHQIARHAEAVNAHHEQVGRDKVHRETLDKRETTLRELKNSLDRKESALRIQANDQRVHRATLDLREESITSAPKKLDNVEAKVQKLGDRAQKAVASQTPEKLRSNASRMQAFSFPQSTRNPAQTAAEPLHETSAGVTTPQTPVVVSFQQKRRLDTVHSGSHKRHTSSQGQASHPDSVSSETEEPLGATLSFGERSSAVETQTQTQTQSEAVAEPAQARTTLQPPVAAPAQTTSQQSVATPAQGETANIWSRLMFSSNWDVKDQASLRKELDRFQHGPDAYRPLVIFDKISKRQANGDELCWISQSMKTRGDFTTHGTGRACSNCVRNGRLCLRIEQAPPQSGKSYLVTRRP